MPRKPAAKPTSESAEQLDEYARKRDFEVTPEPGPVPEGRPPWAGDGLAFVIHEHHARTLHFDLRLEWGGVLMSWAVPKGPSLDPENKRLAVHVEDHPLEYGAFEGEIPAGEYGAGQVIIWDCGTWEPVQDPAETLPKGELKFVLHGVKLSGAWILVRMKPRPGEKRENWLLFKERGAEARPGSDTLAELPGSVSDRCLPRPRGGGASAGSSEAGAGTSAAGAPAPADPASLPGAVAAPLPARIAPMLAVTSDHTPEGDGWIHEIKLDGYRTFARIEDGHARMLSRNGLDWTDKFGPIAEALSALPVRDALLDGEVSALGHGGVSGFSALQDALSSGDTSRLSYSVFDLPHDDGYDLTGVPLTERKRLLAELVATLPPEGPVRYADHIRGHGPEFHQHACEFALEGVVSKRTDSTYSSGRSRSWVKSKCLLRQEFVVGGFTGGAGRRAPLGALLVGYHDAGGSLRFAGRVGSGFDEQTVKALSDALRTIETPDPPFTDLPAGTVAKGMHWVRPVLVAEVAFAEWTRGGVLRQPVFKGLREDKDPTDVVREDVGDEEETGGQSEARGSGGAPASPAAGVGAAGAKGPRRGLPEPPSPSSPRKASADTSRPVRVASVRLTHPDRKLFEGSTVTKLDLARYYEAVADLMLPHATGRPLTLMRCPHGMAEECFYQRHVGRDIPKHVRSVPVPGMSDPEGFIAIDGLEGLLELVQLGALELHAWGARATDPDRPDRLVWDLDPDPELPFADVADAARLVRMRVESLGLSAFVDATGGKGLHVVTPIVPDTEWGPAEAFARGLAEDVARVSPRRFTTDMRKDRRVGGIFLDYVRNTKSSSTIVPYSTRAREGAPVCAPLEWEELERLDEAPQLTVADVAARVVAGTDPWAGFEDGRRPVTAEARASLGLQG